MGSKTDKVKRRYLDLRNGHVVLSPVLQFSNFVMISYLAVNEIIPIWIFAPIILTLIISSMIIIGRTFRKKQLSTDMDLNYEKASANALTTYQMMLAQQNIMDHMIIPYPEGFEERLEYMRRIAQRNL